MGPPLRGKPWMLTHPNQVGMVSREMPQLRVELETFALLIEVKHTFYNFFLYNLKTTINGQYDNQEIK